LADFKLFCSVPSKAWRKPWNVDARPVGRGDTAFGYLARYIQKTALDSARILDVTDAHVTIAWIDRQSGQRRTAQLTGGEFLRRFLQHVLPKGFVRVRHFETAKLPGPIQNRSHFFVSSTPDRRLHRFVRHPRPEKLSPRGTECTASDLSTSRLTRESSNQG
jgi:hypothetical protein